MSTLLFSSINYSGFVADVTFTASTGAEVDLGQQTIPFVYELENPYGNFNLVFTAYSKTCSIEIPNPTPTPTPSITPTLTINLSPTPTNTYTPSITPTNTNTPTVTPSTGAPPFTGYGFNLIDSPYAPPPSGEILFTDFGSGGVVGITNPNTFVSNGVYWSYIDNTSTNRKSFFTGLTTGPNYISFTHNGNSAIYSASSTSFFFDDDNLNVVYNPFLEPSNLVLIQNSPFSFVLGEEVQINFSGV